MNNGKLLSEAQKLIKKDKLDEAQAVLDSIAEHGGRWHFVQSELYFKKNWTTECKKHLERAMELEPENKEYTAVYNRMNEYVQPDDTFENPYSKKQMGKTDMKNFCAEFCCECCGIVACEGLCEAICNGI